MPILENYHGKTLDVLDVSISILDNIDNTKILLLESMDDDLFVSKSRLVMDQLFDIYETICNFTGHKDNASASRENYAKIKEYTELVILYFIILYRTIKCNIETTTDECKDIIKEFCDKSDLLLSCVL